MLVLLAAALSCVALLPPPAPAIVNGYVPPPSQWPWQTALIGSEPWWAEVAGKPGRTEAQRELCGGTLIRPKVVLTAAHCIVETEFRGPQDVYVLVGRRNLTENVGERLQVAQIVVHPQYDRETDRNDVAVLHLTTASQYQVASLLDPRARLKEGKRATVMGWGRLRSGANAPGSEVLRAADVPLWSASRCGRAYPNYDSHVMVCAGYLNGLVDSCQGDSGGPMMVAQGREWKLLGVVSFGRECALPKFPGVYAWVNGPGIRQFIAAEAAKDPTPSGTLVAQPTPGVRPTPPPADDRRKPRIGHAVLGARGRTLVARFRLSKPAQIIVGVTNRRTRRFARGPVRRTLDAGRQHIDLRGRLKPGRYLLTIVAVDGALNRSARVVPFRVRG